MKTNWISVSLLAFGIASAGVVAVSAQQRPERGAGGGGRGGGPTEAMLAACEAKQSGDSCSGEESDGSAISGSCFAPQGLPLACVPEGVQRGGGGPGGAGPGGGGPPPGQSNSGGEIASTKTFTAGVKCDLSFSGLNAQIGLLSESTWSCSNGQRILTANGIPDHPVGTFPNPANPNTITAQTVNFTVTTNPVVFTGPGGRVKEPVMGLNGVKFDPGTGGACPDEISNPNECPLGPGGGGTWNIEALGQDVFDFGEDENNAHVQPTGMYHYHGVPDGMLSQAALAGDAMQMIGWAADGFPVYARYGFPTIGVMLGELKLMQPSYQLKSTPDTGRPSVDIIPMGTFGQDWEYVEGLGDLDQCNGRFGSTPEFPEGIYHYYATDAYPYIQRCVKGSLDNSAQVQRGEGRRQEGGRGRGRGRGEGGRRGGGGQRGGGPEQ